MRISPTKARRVVNLVRGLPAKEALTVLQFATQAASEPVYKVLASRDRERREQRAARPGLAAGQRGVRRRGPDAEAVPAAGAGPGVPDPQAHLPHHHRGGVGGHGDPGPAGPLGGEGRQAPAAPGEGGARRDGRAAAEDTDAPAKKATKKAARPTEAPASDAPAKKAAAKKAPAKKAAAEEETE